MCSGRQGSWRESGRAKCLWGSQPYPLIRGVSTQTANVFSFGLQIVEDRDRTEHLFPIVFGVQTWRELCWFQSSATEGRSWSCGVPASPGTSPSSGSFQCFSMFNFGLLCHVSWKERALCSNLKSRTIYKSQFGREDTRGQRSEKTCTCTCYCSVTEERTRGFGAGSFWANFGPCSRVVRRIMLSTATNCRWNLNWFADKDVCSWHHSWREPDTSLPFSISTTWNMLYLKYCWGKEGCKRYLQNTQVTMQRLLW